ncbi:MAG: hypothetical protein GY757_37695, partial [bacterium]|nr:hypothetical protein [bacterium]
MRVGMIKIKRSECILMLDMHHIITDGVSAEIMMRELAALYQGQTLPPLEIEYKDYTHWQYSEKHRQAIKRQENYWFDNFAGELPVLN